MKIPESTPQTDSSRPRGRPRIAGHDLTTRQAPVLEAAGRLLAMRPSGDISVEHLLQETGPLVRLSTAGFQAVWIKSLIS